MERKSPSSIPAEPDKALRVDVRVLGDLLGEVLRTQAGSDVYETVERVREEGKALRVASGDEEDPALRSLYSVIEDIPPERVREVVRAFSLFLTFTNIAEQRHKVRLRRLAQERVNQGAPEEPRVDSSHDTFAQLLAAGISKDELYEAAISQQVEFVLTAHPTQVVRRTLLARYNRIADALKKGDNPHLTLEEQHAVRDQLRREVSTVWHTDELHRSRPTPLDEVRGGLAVLEQSLWDAVPRFLRRFDRALIEHTGKGLPIDAAPIVFGSWIGGDRDGNPNVTAPVTEEAVRLCRWTAAKLLHDEVDECCQELSMGHASSARAAAETQVGLVGEQALGLDAPLGNAAHQVDASPGRRGLAPGLAIGGAALQTEPAVDAVEGLRRRSPPSPPARARSLHASLQSDRD